MPLQKQGFAPNQRKSAVSRQGERRTLYWFGDTAWEIFHRANREDAEHYLKKRAEQRFTVIQAVVLAEFQGIREPNAYGDLPLVGEDPTRPARSLLSPCGLDRKVGPTSSD